MAIACRFFGRLTSISFWMRLSAALLAVYCGTVLVLLILEDRIVYHPAGASERWADPPAGFEVHDLGLCTRDGVKIHGRWFPRTNARGAVLICHSRAGNVSLELPKTQLEGWQQELGCSVLIFDHPGYGKSEGTPSELGCYDAAEAAYDHMTQTLGVPPRQVLIYGRSLGTAVAIDLASRHDHRALVLVSPFPSLPDVAQTRFPVLPANLLMRNRFDSMAKIDCCRRPIFIVHGTDDTEVPFECGVRLFDAATGSKRLLAIKGARHGDCVQPDLFPAIREFLESAE